MSRTMKKSKGCQFSEDLKDCSAKIRAKKPTRKRRRNQFKTWRKSGTKDKVCACCEKRNVDINNHLLCEYCYAHADNIDIHDPAHGITSHETRKHLTRMMDGIRDDLSSVIPTRYWTDEDYSQEELQALIDECR